ncbi:MAG: CdaR family protein [Turicibacter sp.]|nr:CdaR family protein [Turicibacter sp.]
MRQSSNNSTRGLKLFFENTGKALKGAWKFFTSPTLLVGFLSLKNLDGIYNKIFENEMLLKLLAFLGAFIIVINTRYMPEEFHFRASEVIPNYALTVLQNPDQIIVDGFIPSTIEVVVIGERNQVEMTLLQSNMEFFVDLRQLGSGTYTVHVEHANVNRRVEVRTNPSTFNVTIANQEEIQFPVEGLIVNRHLLSEVDWIISEPQVDLESVTLRGAGALLSEVAVVQGTIDANDILNGQREFTVPLGAFDAEMNHLDLEVLPYEATIRVEVFTESRMVPFTFRIRGNPPPGMSISEVVFSPAEAEVFGEPGVLESISQYEIPLDTSQLNANGEQIILLGAPEGTQYIRQREVTARIIFASTASRTFRNVPIEALNLASDLEIEDQNQVMRVDVVVRGAQRLLEQMSASDIRLHVDLNQLQAGDHNLSIRMETPEFINGDLNEPILQITLIE